jgi:hypothetical protein
LVVNYVRAKQIVEDNREKLVNLAETLMKVETLDREDFEGLMNQVFSEPEMEGETDSSPLSWESPVQSQPSSSL